jgi:hypothetical protein
LADGLLVTSSSGLRCQTKHQYNERKRFRELISGNSVKESLIPDCFKTNYPFPSEWSLFEAYKPWAGQGIHRFSCCRTFRALLSRLFYSPMNAQVVLKTILKFTLK